MRPKRIQKFGNGLLIGLKMLFRRILWNVAVAVVSLF